MLVALAAGAAACEDELRTYTAHSLRYVAGRQLHNYLAQAALAKSISAGHSADSF